MTCRQCPPRHRSADESVGPIRCASLLCQLQRERRQQNPFLLLSSLLRVAPHFWLGLFGSELHCHSWPVPCAAAHSPAAAAHSRLCRGLKRRRCCSSPGLFVVPDRQRPTIVA